MRATCKSKLSDIGKILDEIKRVSKDTQDKYRRDNT